MTSYSTVTEAIRLSCIVFEIYRVICRKSPIFTSSAFGAPVGVTPLEFLGDLWRQKTRVYCVIACIIEAIVSVSLLA